MSGVRGPGDGTEDAGGMKVFRVEYRVRWAGEPAAMIAGLFSAEAMQPVIDGLTVASESMTSEVVKIEDLGTIDDCYSCHQHHSATAVTQAVPNS